MPRKKKAEIIFNVLKKALENEIQIEKKKLASPQELTSKEKKFEDRDWSGIGNQLISKKIEGLKIALEIIKEKAKEHGVEL